MKSFWELYNYQLQRRADGIKFDTHAEYLQLGLKSGKFCEDTISEVAGPTYITKGEEVRISRKCGKKYLADGWFQDLGCYVESKNFSFYSSGTASEKLPNFLIKLEEYDKPALIIFGGEHELLNTGPDQLIWDAFHKGASSSRAMNALVNVVRHNIRDIIGLSSLPQWLQEARQESLKSSL